MAIVHGRSKTKPSGKKIRPSRHKKKYELGYPPTETKLGARRLKIVAARGNTTKQKLLQGNVANILDPKTGKCKTGKITTVSENAANPHFVRRNIMTKGAVIQTELGKARVTNRPGQEGCINAVLLE